LSCWDQYLAMGFSEFTYRESLRDIEACLRSMSDKQYHMVDSTHGLAIIRLADTMGESAGLPDTKWL
jgi:hypothetical protein